VIKVFVLPHIAALAAKIDLALDSSNIGTSKVEEIAAKNIRTLLVKSVSPVLKAMREPPDNIDQYKTIYGSLGPYLQPGVVRARQQSGSKTPATIAQPKLAEMKQVQSSITSSSAQPSTTLVSGQQKVFLVSPQQQIRMTQPAMMSQMLSQLQPHPPQPQHLQRQFSQPGPFQ